VTFTQLNHKLQPQSGTADDLDTISGTTAGQSGTIYVSDFGTDTITLKHNTGNILCVGGTDVALSNGCAFWYSNGTKVFISGGGGGDVTRLADSTLGGSAANFDLTSISGSYKHLRLVYSLRSDYSGLTYDELRVRINNDSGGNYDYAAFAWWHNAQYGTAEGINATSAWSSTTTSSTSPANAFATGYIDFADYANTTTHKTIHARGVLRFDTATGNFRIYDGSGHWKSTSALSRITIFPGLGSNWLTNSRVTLYGYN